MRKWVKTQLPRTMSKVYKGILPSTQNTFSVWLDSIYQGMALMTNYDKITNCDGGVFWFAALCDCRNLWGFKTQLLRLMSKVLVVYTSKYLKHIHTVTGPFAEGFLSTFFCHYNSYTYTHTFMPNNAKLDKNSTSHIHDKSVQGYSAGRIEHVSVWLDSLYHSMALITNCDKSKNSTAAICYLIHIHMHVHIHVHVHVHTHTHTYTYTWRQGTTLLNQFSVVPWNVHKFALKQNVQVLTLRFR